MKHFSTAQAALDYVMPELIATLQDDLARMEGCEAEHSAQGDVEEMRDRIADLEAIAPRVVLA